jgi:hypothetical protein
LEALLVKNSIWGKEVLKNYLMVRRVQAFSLTLIVNLLSLLQAKILQENNNRILWNTQNFILEKIPILNKGKVQKNKDMKRDLLLG